MKLYLRIGVLRGGRLVDDRYVPEKGEVTVGSSAKNMFALLGSHLPKEHVLVHFNKQNPMLHVIEGMTGEIAFDGKTKEPLDKARQKAGKDGAIELNAHARGWVQLSDATFFFQVLPKPPPPPKRELPASAKTGLLSGLETTFLGILVAVMAFEGAAIFAIHRRPTVEIDQPSAEDLDRFAEIIMPEKPKEEPEKKEDDDAKKKAEEEAKKKAEEEAKKKAEEEAKKKKDDEPKDDAALKKAEDERKAKIKEAVSKKGLLSVIGATGGSGALSDLFKSSGFSDDIGSALAGAGGVKFATGDDGPNRKGGTGGGAVGIGDLGSDGLGGGGKVGLAEKKRVAPQITVDDSEFETDSTSVDKDSLGKYIKMRIKSVQGCYEKELKRNPTLKGKIVVRFVVTTQGRVGDVSIDQNTMGDENVPACIVSLIKRWTFPFKPDDDAPVSFPFVFSPGG